MKTNLLFLCAFLLFAVSCSTRKGPSSSAHLTNKGDKPNFNTENHGKNVATVIQAARKYLGTPYKYSGMDSKGMDCSGLMYRTFSEVGLHLPHSSQEQSTLGTSIPLKDLQPGDLIFLGASKGSKKVTHVGMVVKVGDGKIIFIHASTKRGVVEENLLEKWYQPLFIKGTRLF